MAKKVVSDVSKEKGEEPPKSPAKLPSGEFLSIGFFFLSVHIFFQRYEDDVVFLSEVHFGKSK